MTDVIVDGIKNYLEDDIKEERVFDDMTVTDSMSVNLNQNVEEKSWIRQKLNL
jgi:hypothetical protein